ncbi:MAG: hypothetical protein HND52_00510 [Ignavibacteriae bacterium]|nr:hypothetical protein [Ignavibacteriota bacterium]NOG96428.1 hypothetical protein [Ignavibacteriota bacterium]
MKVIKFRHSTEYRHFFIKYLIPKILSDGDLRVNLDVTAESSELKLEGNAGKIEQVSTVVEENSTAAQQIAVNTNEINKNIESISNVSRNNNDNVLLRSSSNDELQNQFEEITDFISSLNKTSNELNLFIGFFKTDINKTSMDYQTKFETAKDEGYVLEPEKINSN